MDIEKKDEIKSKLQDMLDECMSSYNQEGSLEITDIEFNEDDTTSGTGTIKFDWCIPEPKNGNPYFQGY